MLAIKHRFIVYNKTGVTLDFMTNVAEIARLIYIGKKPTNTAGINYGPVQTEVANSDIAPGGTGKLSTIDNTTDQWFALDGVFEVVMDNTSAVGDVVLLRETTTSLSAWPSDVADWDPDTDADVVAVLSLGGAEQKSTNFAVLL